MPKFANPFADKTPDRRIATEELIHAIQYNIAAEHEAIQLYMRMAQSTDNPKARAVLVDLANEERDHIGEFMELLKELAPDDEKSDQVDRQTFEKIFTALDKS